MLSLFRKRAAPEPAPPRTVPAGRRVYAVGDIHGRLDLLDDLIARIAPDDAAREAGRNAWVVRAGGVNADWSWPGGCPYRPLGVYGVPPFPMLSLFRKRAPPEPATPRTVPAGRRVYAVGDIHGRLDLLDDLIARIDADDAARDGGRTDSVFLGDLVDRGPDSAGEIGRAHV